MLYVVATPIGNLADISERAIQTLQSADYVACEDTRHSKTLLKHIGANAPTLSFHSHSGDGRLNEILGILQEGKTVALITDAGTPGISDPGGTLIAKAHELGITISAIPGPSSVTTALSVSGFNTDQFVFLGFLPKKKGRQTLFKEMLRSTRTIVFFESPHRIAKTVQDLHDILDHERRICICRELTKQFEEVRVSTVAEWLTHLPREQGEFVVVVEGVR